ECELLHTSTCALTSLGVLLLFGGWTRHDWFVLAEQIEWLEEHRRAQRAAAARRVRAGVSSCRQHRAPRIGGDQDRARPQRRRDVTDGELERVEVAPAFELRGLRVGDADSDESGGRVDDRDGGITVLQYRQTLRPDQHPLQRRVRQIERLTSSVE